VPDTAAAQYRARARERRICVAAGGHVAARSARFFAHFGQEWAVIVKKISACGALLEKLFFHGKILNGGLRSVGGAGGVSHAHGRRDDVEVSRRRKISFGMAG
jgi:hypothetical protein